MIKNARNVAFNESDNRYKAKTFRSSVARMERSAIREFRSHAIPVFRCAAYVLHAVHQRACCKQDVRTPTFFCLCARRL